MGRYCFQYNPAQSIELPPVWLLTRTGSCDNSRSGHHLRLWAMNQHETPTRHFTAALGDDEEEHTGMFFGPPSSAEKPYFLAVQRQIQRVFIVCLPRRARLG
jgi:hypothetical protein